MVPLDSVRITRAPTYSGYCSLFNIFVYGTITRYGHTFQSVLLTYSNAKCSPTTPMASHRFGLFPVRSPLLGESRLISLPEGTEMFHFPSFALHWSDMYLYIPGCPIRKSPDQSLLAAPRGLSQPSTSFIASSTQGIHRLLLVAYYPLIVFCVQ